MNEKVKFLGLHVENAMRLKALDLRPAQDGLTILGGLNGQGKTTALKCAQWLVGGAKFKPSRPHRDGAMTDPDIVGTFNNGLVVKRTGKNGTLQVIDAAGNRGGQALLDAFVSQFAIDLPKFMIANDKEKARILLDVLGIGEILEGYDETETRLYNERHAVGQVADAKAKHAEELPEYADAPTDLISVSDLLKNQQAILAKNGENQRKREQVKELERERDNTIAEMERRKEAVAVAEQRLKDVLDDLEKVNGAVAIAQKSAEQIQDESTAELEASLADIEVINAQVSANKQKEIAADEATEYRAQYDALTEKIEAIRADRLALLEGADLPLPGLTVQEGTLLYNGDQWDAMSGSDQLKVATAIGSRINPDCGFALLDKLEGFDLNTLQDFHDWLIAEGLQGIATRVSTGDECTLIIEDGLPQGQTYAEVVTGVMSSDDDSMEF